MVCALRGMPFRRRIACSTPHAGLFERFLPVEQRLLLFFVLAVVVVFANVAVLEMVGAPPTAAAPEAPLAQNGMGEKHARQANGEAAEKKSSDEMKGAGKAAEVGQPKVGAEAAAKPMAAEPPVAEQWATLGSADPGSPYRMLATFTNEGAAVVRIELSSLHYRDLADRGGYLGHVVMPGRLGLIPCRVDVVGDGTPAAKAGLQPGDVIEKLGEFPISTGHRLAEVLRTKTEPGRKVTLSIRREGKLLSVPVELIRRPLEVVRPDAQPLITDPTALVPREDLDPFSFLFTLYQIDGKKLGEPEKDLIENSRELPGVELRTANWTIDKRQGPQEPVVFRRKLPNTVWRLPRPTA